MAKVAKVSRMGGSGKGKGNGQELKDWRWLSLDEFEECKKSFLCFRCFTEGKELKDQPVFTQTTFHQIHQKIQK